MMVDERSSDGERYKLLQKNRRADLTEKEVKYYHLIIYRSYHFLHVLHLIMLMTCLVAHPSSVTLKSQLIAMNSLPVATFCSNTIHVFLSLQHHPFHSFVNRRFYECTQKIHSIHSSHFYLLILYFPPNLKQLGDSLPLPTSNLHGV